MRNVGYYAAGVVHVALEAYVAWECTRRAAQHEDTHELRNIFAKDAVAMANPASPPFYEEVETVRSPAPGPLFAPAGPSNVLMSVAGAAVRGGFDGGRPRQAFAGVQDGRAPSAAPPGGAPRRRGPVSRPR